MNCSQQLELAIANLTACQALLDNASPTGEDECGPSTGKYTLTLHVIALVVVLLSSAIGTCFPLLAAHVPCLAVHPFAFVLGKCASAGVVLAVALVHMLQPANEQLGASCIPKELKNYGAYAFAFAMAGAILMHTLDLVFALCLHTHLLPEEELERKYLDPQENPAAISTTNHRSVERHGPSPSSDAHGHSHGEMGRESTPLQRAAAAILMEFGVTVHSVMIGLTIGVSNDAEVSGLLTALCFHQLFEGVALGSRLAEANFRVSSELILASMFIVSAPLGIGIGMGVVGTNALTGAAFFVVAGVCDAVTAGILLYLGFGLLYCDFPRDMAKHAVGPHATLRLVLMVGSLYVGAALLAYLGKYI